jgi:hypothetical protein
LSGGMLRPYRLTVIIKWDNGKWGDDYFCDS